ncbi:MAG: hypothetical protein GY806_16450 [Gammaproteobacteria bacterium]|nr:hypothetical protein [Gammaproteobacteria bacterium]
MNYELQWAMFNHRAGDITTYYSAPKPEELIEAANRVCEDSSGKNPALVIPKQKHTT